MRAMLSDGDIERIFRHIFDHRVEMTALPVEQNYLCPRCEAQHPSQVVACSFIEPDTCAFFECGCGVDTRNTHGLIPGGQFNPFPGDLCDVSYVLCADDIRRHEIDDIAQGPQ